MAVKIRLKRMGKIRQPYYRIVVADSRTKRDGRVIEEIGKYHPKEDPSIIEVDSERAQHWLSVGAQPSEPVAVLLKLTGDWQKFKGEAAPGPMKFAEAKRTKEDRYNEAVKDLGAEPKSEAVTGRGAKKKAASEPKADKPKADKPKADKSEADEPAADEPAADKSEADEPAADEPAVDEPAVDEAKADKSETDAPEAEKPEAEKPEAEKSTAEKPEATDSATPDTAEAPPKGESAEKSEA